MFKISINITSSLPKKLDNLYKGVINKQRKIYVEKSIV